MSEVQTIHQTTANIVTTDPVQIVVTQQSSDLWHKTLNALWDDGVIAGMPDDAYRVLGAYLRLRHSDTGIANASVGEIMRITGRSRTYVYRGRQRVMDSPHALMTARPDIGRDAYHVLPGWTFRGRGFSSQPGDGAVPARGFSSQPGDALKEVRIRDSRLDVVREATDDELVEMLTRESPSRPGGPFSRSDAIGLLNETKASRFDVDAACRNAEALARQADPSARVRNWRAYTAKQLRTGVTLIAPLQKQDDERRRNWEVVTRLLTAAGDTQDARAVAEWWNGMGPERQAAALGTYERGRTDEWIWGAMVAKAARSRR